jgi:hypothetical protein
LRSPALLPRATIEAVNVLSFSAFVTLATITGALVALPSPAALGGLARLRSPAWALVGPGSVLVGTFGVLAMPSLATGLAILAAVATPVLAAIAMVGGRARRPARFVARMVRSCWARRDAGAVAGSQAGFARGLRGLHLRLRLRQQERCGGCDATADPGEEIDPDVAPLEHAQHRRAERDRGVERAALARAHRECAGRRREADREAARRGDRHPDREHQEERPDELDRELARQSDHRRASDSLMVASV